MGHYLQLLAARALGSARVARPRLPSLFGDDPAAPLDDGPRTATHDRPGPPPSASAAPPRSPGVDLRAAPFEPQATSPIVARVAVSSAGAPGPTAAAPAPAADAQTLAPAARREDVVAAPPAVIPRPADVRGAERPVDGPAPAPALAMRRTEVPHAPIPVSLRTPQRPLGADPPSSPAAPPALGDPVVAAPQARAVAERFGRRVDAAPGDLPDAAPGTMPVASLRPAAPLAASPPPALRSMARAAGFSAASVAAPVHRSAPRAAAEPPAATTVNVTIGRLEIRASAAPATVARAERRPGPAPTGLEQYLQRRARGGSAA